MPKVFELRATLLGLATVAVLAATLAVGACASAPHESVVFAPFVDGDLRARRQPATLSSASPEQLQAEGYAAIGELLVIRVTSICYETCKKIEHELDCTATLLAKAAEHGGELVTLALDNDESSRAVTKPGDCIEHYTRTEHSMVFVAPEPGSGETGTFEHQRETRTVCTEFEAIHGTERFQQSVGVVWARLDVAAPESSD